MSTTLIDIQDLPHRFKELVSLAAAGAEVIVTEGDVPRARLVPLATGQPRVAGLHPGAFVMADDFDAPLPDDFWASAP
jgi:antitoxin (DNA-binding transcriptional repressor) of toxin-antitoxin stability system